MTFKVSQRSTHHSALGNKQSNWAITLNQIKQLCTNSESSWARYSLDSSWCSSIDFNDTIENYMTWEFGSSHSEAFQNEDVFFRTSLHNSEGKMNRWAFWSTKLPAVFSTILEVNSLLDFFFKCLNFLWKTQK